MKLDVPRFTERFGSVSLHGVQRVYELDSGHKNKQSKTESEVIRSIDDEIISKIESEMSIVIPIKGERLKLLEGVLSGIPHDCLTVIVSNSPREPIDRYKLEKQAFEQFNRFTEK
ncbi:MAG TPA: mannosyl-3-phosphoglycerate synthase, partial [Nitrososphaeraceae archaeon]